MRCVNCHLNISRSRRHRLSELSDQLLETVQRWVHPCNISKEDYMCHQCWGLINDSPNESGHDAEQRLGHRNVCAGCGKSILRKWSMQVLSLDMSETKTRIGNIISKWIRPRQLTFNDRICKPCRLRAERAVNISLGSSSKNKRSKSSANPVEKTSEKVNMELVNPLQDESAEEMTSRGAAHIASRCSIFENSDNLGELVVKIEEGNLEEDTSAEQTSTINNIAVTDEHIPLQDKTANQITLPTLRRAAGTAHRCLFSGCKNNERYHMSDVLRKRIIKDFNFFIPRFTRICRFHLHSNLFHDLYAAKNAISTFSATQIEEIVFLLSDDTKLDLHNPESIDEHLFQYLFGQTKKEFTETLIEIPRLCDPKMKIGFCALLCKTRSRDSSGRIAQLFQMPRRTLENYMVQAREILSEYCESVKLLSEENQRIAEALRKQMSQVSD